MSQYPECKHGHSDPNFPCMKCIEEERSATDLKYMQQLHDELAKSSKRIARLEIALEQLAEPGHYPPNVEEIAQNALEDK